MTQQITEAAPWSEREVLLNQDFSLICFFFFAQQGLTHNKCHAATEVGAVGATVAQARGGGGGAQVMNATGTTEPVDSGSCGLMALTTITAGPQGVPSGPKSNTKVPAGLDPGRWVWLNGIVNKMTKLTSYSRKWQHALN